MATVRDLLKFKGSNVYSVTPETKVVQALELMAGKSIGAVLIIRDDKLQGIFSERDYARKVFLKGKDSRSTSIGEVMTSQVYIISLDERIEDCMNLMTNHKFRHLPVLEGDKVVGLISIGDVVRQVINDQQFLLEAQERYITGSY